MCTFCLYPSRWIRAESATATVTIRFVVFALPLIVVVPQKRLLSALLPKVIKMYMGQRWWNKWKIIIIIIIMYRIVFTHSGNLAKEVSSLVFDTLLNLCMHGVQCVCAHREYDGRSPSPLFFYEWENDCLKLLLLLFSVQLQLLLLWLVSKRLSWQCRRTLSLSLFDVRNSLLRRHHHRSYAFIFEAQIIMIEIIQYLWCVECQDSSGGVVRSRMARAASHILSPEGISIIFFPLFSLSVLISCERDSASLYLKSDREIFQ